VKSWDDPVAASRAVNNPATSGPDLAAIAARHSELHSAVAWHPKVYPGLLAWLAEHSEPQVARAARIRLAARAVRSDKSAVRTLTSDPDTTSKNPVRPAPPLPIASEMSGATVTPPPKTPSATVISTHSATPRRPMAFDPPGFLAAKRAAAAASAALETDLHSAGAWEEPGPTVTRLVRPSVTAPAAHFVPRQLKVIQAKPPAGTAGVTDTDEPAEPAASRPGPDTGPVVSVAEPAPPDRVSEPVLDVAVDEPSPVESAIEPVQDNPVLAEAVLAEVLAEPSPVEPAIDPVLAEAVAEPSPVEPAIDPVQDDPVRAEATLAEAVAEPVTYEPAVEPDQGEMARELTPEPAIEPAPGPPAPPLVPALARPRSTRPALPTVFRPTPSDLALVPVAAAERVAEQPPAAVAAEPVAARPMELPEATSVAVEPTQAKPAVASPKPAKPIKKAAPAAPAKPSRKRQPLSTRASVVLALAVVLIVFLIVVGGLMVFGVISATGEDTAQAVPISLVIPPGTS